jgi:excisionase family DNA binding protein
MSSSLKKGHISQAVMAERLGVSTPTIRRKIAAGEITAIRVGQQLRISEEEFDRFVAASTLPTRTGGAA